MNAAAAGSICLESAAKFSACLADNVLNPLLLLLFAIALLVFIWGIVQFMWGLSSEAGEGSADGKRHMLWGLAGMFVMVAAYSIVKIISSTLGVSLP